MAVTCTRWLYLGFAREVTVSLTRSSQALSSAVRVCSEDGEFQKEDPSPAITWQWYLLCAWRYVVHWKNCGYSRCPNRKGSYVEQLGTTWSQVSSIAVWSIMGINAQFHTLDRGRKTVDGRTVPIPTRGLNVHISPSHYVPWTVARLPPMIRESIGWTKYPTRRSRAQATCELAGLPTSSLGASSPGRELSLLAGRELAECELEQVASRTSSQVASSQVAS
ncbi:UNVERIFIED_CONTAM: hypothetical protein Sradi_6964400 [Sesamum radiatum]|uniref:Uncharacterized protein n=1 Tax=Sesamum radiatum TaxID=300843 RepID=A0AAW2JGG0_SESRA